MTKPPLVSVLIATFNQVNLINETINSVLAQDYPNLEILISDDGSTDGTREILTDIAANNPSIKLFLQEKNLGITNNYNFLAESASGEYVGVFAGDDLMCANKILLQIQLLEANRSASFCHHSVYNLDGVTGTVRGVTTHKYKNNKTTIVDVLRNFGIPGSMSVVYRRSLMGNPAFDPRISTASDWLQIIHLTMKGEGLYINEPLCYYRKYSNYNQKDPAKYEQDFVKTIEISRATYAKRGDHIDKACDYAMARYSLGAGFRSLVRVDRVNARKHFSAPMPNIKFAFYATFLKLISYLPVTADTFAKFRYIVKTFRKN